jgi:hypothetical protein
MVRVSAFKIGFIQLILKLGCCLKVINCNRVLIVFTIA